MHEQNSCKKSFVFESNISFSEQAITKRLIMLLSKPIERPNQPSAIKDNTANKFTVRLLGLYSCHLKYNALCIITAHMASNITQVSNGVSRLRVSTIKQVDSSILALWFIYSALGNHCCLGLGRQEGLPER